MNKHDELAGRIVKLLDEGVDRLGTEQREALSEARQRALARYRTAQAPALVPAWAGPFSRFTEHSFMGVRYLLPVALLVLGLMGVVYVQSGGTTNELADIDAGLLSDELPINAYLDQGFDSWLKRSSR